MAIVFNLILGRIETYIFTYVPELVKGELRLQEVHLYN